MIKLIILSVIIIYFIRKWGTGATHETSHYHNKIFNSCYSCHIHEQLYILHFYKIVQRGGGGRRLRVLPGTKFSDCKFVEENVKCML